MRPAPVRCRRQRPNYRRTPPPLVNLRPPLGTRVRSMRKHRLLDQNPIRRSGPNQGSDRCATKALIDDVMLAFDVDVGWTPNAGPSAGATHDYRDCNGQRAA